MLREMVMSSCRGSWLWWPGAAALTVLLGVLGMSGCNDAGRSQRIGSLVRDLDKAPFGIFMLGTPEPMIDDTVEELISYGNEAVPELVAALDSDNPVRAGYAAFCLMKIGNRKGVGRTGAALLKWENVKSVSYKDRFAVKCLKDYISGSPPGND